MAYFDKRRNAWVARDGSGDRHYIGSFDTREEAEEKEQDYKESASPLLTAYQTDLIQQERPTGIWALVNDKSLWQRAKEFFKR